MEINVIFEGGKRIKLFFQKLIEVPNILCNIFIISFQPGGGNAIYVGPNLKKENYIWYQFSAGRTNQAIRRSFRGSKLICLSKWRWTDYVFTKKLCDVLANVLVFPCCEFQYQNRVSGICARSKVAKIHLKYLRHFRT